MEDTLYKKQFNSEEEKELEEIKQQKRLNIDKKNIKNHHSIKTKINSQNFVIKNIKKEFPRSSIYKISGLIYQNLSLMIFIFLDLIRFSFCQKNNQNFDNYINLTIIGQGSKTKILNFIYMRRRNYPSEVIINEKSTHPKISNMICDYDDQVGTCPYLVVDIKAKTVQENIIIKWNKTIDSAMHMFSEIDSIISIDLSHLDFSLVTSTRRMFYKCDINTVNLSNLNFSSLKSMDWMFEFSDIESIYLNNLNTKSLESLRDLFSGANSLKYIYINNIDTSKVTEINLNQMFYNCGSLKSVTLINLNFSKVKKINNIFSYSPLLETLIFYNITTGNLKDMSYMLYNHSKLIYVNITNFNTSSVTDINHAFAECNNLISINLNTFNFQNVVNMSRMFYNCKNLKYINIEQFHAKSEQALFYSNMFYGTSDFLVYCLNKNLENTDKIKSQLLAKECAIEYCLDDWDTKIKKFFNGTNICIESCSNISFFDYNGVCYQECPEGTKSSYKNKYICENVTKDDDVVQITNNNNEIKYKYDKDLIYNLLNENNNNDNINENKQYDEKGYQKIVNNFFKKIKDGSMDEILNNINENNENNNTDFFIQSGNIIIHISSINNQNNNNYNNISSINIDEECEIQLKDKYHIAKNISLLLLKSEYFTEGIKIPFIRYDIINPLTKEILDLKFCENMKIDMEIPVNIDIDIDETNINKYNKESEFYTDICYPYNNKEGIDLTLFDRKKEYNFFNYSLCLNKCTFIGYNNITKKVSCRCDTQSQVSNLLLEEVLSKEKLLDNFINIKSISNLGIINCFKKIIIKINFKSNYCSSIIIVIILLLIIFCTIFYSKSYGILFKKIDRIADSKKQELKKKDKSMNNNEVKHEILKKDKDNNTNNNKGKDKKYISLKKVKNKKRSKNKYTSNSSNLKIKNKFLNNTIKINNENSENKINNKTDDPPKTNINLKDSEINSYSYEDAIKNDKRTFLQYYISLIKIKYILISPFTNNEYNSKMVKLSLVFYSFSQYLFINSLFFTDATMHKIYKDGGIFNLAYSLPQIFYSFIISTIINILIKFLALFEGDIIKIKLENNYSKIKKDLPRIKRKIKIKLALFFILCFGLLIFFGCYLTCFGSIYKNTQIYLLKDTLISFALSLLYPFILYLIPAALRISILKYPHYLYKLSKLLE